MISYYAKMLLKDLGLKNPPISPKKVAEMLEIPVWEREAADRYDGYLIRYNDTFGIVVNKSISYEPRKNFTIAHEIGHAQIPHHQGNEYQCLKEDIGFSSTKKQEQEANEFAAELLMPGDFILDKAEREEISLELIKSISDACQTSLTSSALRYINFCPELAGVAVSKNREIDYFFPSPSMKKKNIFLPKGTTLEKTSVAYSLFDNDGKVPSSNEQEVEIDTSAWFPCFNNSQYDCFEASIAFPNFDRVISLIWLFDKYGDEEDGDDDIF